MRHFNNLPPSSGTDLRSLVKFPPSPNSKLCNDQPCDSVSWSIKVGPGKFKVSITCGDPTKDTKADLVVNDEYFLENEFIPLGTIKRGSKIVESISDFITIKSECKVNCDSAISKMNTVEIEPYREPNSFPDGWQDSKEAKNGAASADIAKGDLPVIIEKCAQLRDNYENCLFDDTLPWVSSNCGGDLSIMKITKEDNDHKKFYNKLKCARTVYKTQELCNKYCPRTKCTNGSCDDGK